MARSHRASSFHPCARWRAIWASIPILSKRLTRNWSAVAGKGSFIAGGDSAGETLRMRSLEKIRDALESGRRAGVSRAQALETVEYVYKEANV